jgi:hypothetical protein
MHKGVEKHDKPLERVQQLGVPLKTSDTFLLFEMWEKGSVI